VFKNILQTEHWHLQGFANVSGFIRTWSEKTLKPIKHLSQRANPVLNQT
jgi:hypothetical protein